MVTRKGQNVRIGPKKPRRIFLREWRKSIQPTMTQQRLADLLETTKTSVSRWEAWGAGERNPKKAREPNTGVLEAIAEVLGREAPDLYHHPSSGGSLWAIIDGMTEEKQREAAAILRALRDAGKAA